MWDWGTSYKTVIAELIVIHLYGTHSSVSIFSVLSEARLMGIGLATTGRLRALLWAIS